MLKRGLLSEAARVDRGPRCHIGCSNKSFEGALPRSFRALYRFKKLAARIMPHQRSSILFGEFELWWRRPVQFERLRHFITRDSVVCQADARLKAVARSSADYGEHAA